MARRQERAQPDASDAAAARRAAVKILKTRLVSRAAIVTRLVRQGFERGAAAAAAAELEAIGLLDDRKLAESLVRKQMGGKAVGERVLVAKLRQRGISSGAAKAAAEEGLKGRDEVADAVDLARRRVRTFKAGLDAQVVRQRVFGYLARRGFGSEACRTAVDRVCRPSEEPEGF